ncbi:DUF2147 domain-containing protein [Algoriphagus lacus]|uniref:DUF2147 domain-containing protein n=1 Tax=Algoriphagus lacus TaxID=2056311 RepID=A0A418PRV9_9BACT|nr:DUF2147 domain-containing protein [Algoriphagus lacus]RIW15609.1 DUF2147 domain-containing protein [Algoriphagus lacus]
MNNRQFISLFLLLFLGMVWNIQAQSENAILGLWYNTEKTAQIQIIKSGSEYIGKIIWVKNPNTDGKPVLDKQNTDPKLRTRPIVGLSILDGLKYAGGIWKDGEIYDPNSGKTYSCELRLKSESILEVKGYLGFSFVGKTVEWFKVK